MEKDFSFLDDLQVIAEEDILDSGLDRERIWLIQTAEGTIFGPYLEDELRKVAQEHGRALSYCNACRMADRQWKLFFDHPQFQRRVEVPFPPLLPRHQENFEEFSILHNGQRHGPYSPEAIQQMLIKKILNMQSLISADKGKTWKKVYHFELFDRRRDGKFSIPTPVKTHTLNKIKIAIKESEQEIAQRQATASNGQPLTEELTSTLMLGQKQMKPRSPRNVHYQFQREFGPAVFSRSKKQSDAFSLKTAKNFFQTNKKQLSALGSLLGLAMVFFLGRQFFFTKPSQVAPVVTPAQSQPQPPQAGRIEHKSRRSKSNSPSLFDRPSEREDRQEAASDRGQDLRDNEREDAPYERGSEYRDRDGSSVSRKESPRREKAPIKRIGDVFDDSTLDESASSEDQEDSSPYDDEPLYGEDENLDENSDVDKRPASDEEDREPRSSTRSSSDRDEFSQDY